jgi:ATP-binding cassette subfamily C protein
MKSSILELRGFARELIRADPSRGIRPMLLAIGGAATEGAGLMLLAPIIGVLAAGSNVGGGTAAGPLAKLTPHLPPGREAQILALVGTFCALMAVRSLIVVARDVSFARLHSAFLEQTRMTVLERVASAGWDRVASLEHGRVTHLLSADFHACTVAGASLINVVLSAILLAMLVAVAFALSPMLAATISVLLILLAAILAPSLSVARRSGATLATLGQRMTSDLGQFLAGLKPALAANLEREFITHIHRLQRDQARQLIASTRKQSEARALTLFVAGIVGASTLAAGGLVFDAAAPELLAMLVVLARLGGPCLQLQQSLQQLQQNMPMWSRIKALEDELAADAGRAHVSPPPPLGTISLNAVRYCHPGTGSGVVDLDLTIVPGSFVAVIGESGAGKTTLADLLAGLLMPQSGTIECAGTPLTGTNIAGWRDTIAYVPQDSFLLNGSIRRNLLWGIAAADDHLIAAALRTAGADHVVAHRPNGLETIVGERGVLLSGGERQRIALARALLRRPRLMILDEATNAVDLEIERRIFANLALLPERPAVLAISHRTGTLDLFDRIYRMEGGRLARVSSAGPRAESTRSWQTPPHSHTR